MSLSNATAQSIVGFWSMETQSPFTPLERDALADALIALSAEVTVHIVPDAILSDTEKDQILSDRVLSCLDDWIAIVSRTFRRQYGLDSTWRDAQALVFPVGLNSATRQERIALPVLGAQLSDRLAAYLALNPDVSFDELENVSGLGPAGLKTLSEYSYLDRPSLGVMSPSMLAFVDRPQVSTLLELMDATDIDVAYGDWVTHTRRGPQAKGLSGASRLRTFIDFVKDQISAAPFVARGVLASEASATLERQQAMREKRAAAMSGTADLVVNDAYVATALSVIESASSDLSLMVFLGTDARAVPGGVAPDVLIEALEAANGSVDVRVILDQDDIGEPYLSKAINMPLFHRLKAAGVAVKFDAQNTLLHSKLFIADGATALVGSHNWTRSSFNNTHEISLLVQQVDVAQSYQMRFDALRASLPD